LVYCSIPVVLVTAFVIWRRTADDAPYVAGEETEGITRALDRESAQPECPLRFTEVTEAAGIDFRHFPFRRTSQLPEDMGSGAAWADYDGDERTDLFLVNIAAPVGASAEDLSRSTATDRLYRNLGDGTFEDVTESAGVGAAHVGNGAAWADYDVDGDPDLFVTSWGENILWENRGNGTFADVTERAGLTGEGFWAGADWGDFDLDGDPDLYVCGYLQYEPQDPEDMARIAAESDFPFTLNPSSWPPHPNRFYVNRGDGTFEERAAMAGVLGENGRSLGAAWTDLDGDGLLDLYVANDVSDNALYRNRGDGTFENVSYEALVADYRGAMGLAVGDWDGDLDLDLFVTHWIAQENALYSNLLKDLAEGGESDQLMFVDDADRVGLGQAALDNIGWGTGFVDLDLDGWLDLFVANGSTFQERDDPSRLVPMDPHLYWNRGPEKGFFEVAEAAALRTDPPGVARGAAFCDYDADGDLDLLICRHGGRARLLRNDSRRGHGVTLRLRDAAGRSAAAGTRIVTHAGGRAFLREFGGGPSYLSQHAPDVVTGLGEVTRVDSVEVTWAGGSREVWRDLGVDRTWVLESGAAPALVSSGGAGSEGMTREEIRRFWKLKREADDLVLARRWEEALAALDRVLALDPHHEDSLYGRGNCFLELGRYGEAEQAWRELVRVNPAAARAWLQIGLVHSLPAAGDLFDLARADEALQEAHRINPESSGPLILQGEAALARGDFAAAESILTSAWNMNAQATSALYLCGYLAWKRGEQEPAHELLGRAVQSLARSAPKHGVLGEGDTKSADLETDRRRSAGRRLFAECLDFLREAGPDVDPVAAFSRVDEQLARLP
jgi:tetratricopeptide (TPR) repeat protein